MLTITVNLLLLVCSDGTVRLGNQSYGVTTEGYSIIEGTVEVCINGTFGPICSGPHWDEVDAGVVCRSLGYYPPEYCKSLWHCRLEEMFSKKNNWVV